tara:strand:+ start:412 stop:594 length:183 start_codon:yes stop_codon:yes gene_type:complete
MEKNIQPIDISKYLSIDYFFLNPIVSNQSEIDIRIAIPTMSLLEEVKVNHAMKNPRIVKI